MGSSYGRSVSPQVNGECYTLRMLLPSDLTQHLRDIAGNSYLQFADLAAGNVDSQDVRFNYASESLTDTNIPGCIRAAELPDRRYLIASITKPVVTMMGVQLAAEGRLSLNEPVRDFVEGFNRGPLRNITIRHLMTHTSGLPDMLPNNTELRMQHSTLSDFVDHTAQITPDFVAGTDCRYSSMGIAVLAVIIEQVTNSHLPELLHHRLFKPLEMNSSWLGLPIDQAADLMPTVVPCELPPWQQQASAWNWNSLYWRTLGAPWGGMISTAEDLGRLAVAILNRGASKTGEDVLRDATIVACTRNQTRHIAALAEADRIQRPWGLGWRFNWPDHATCFSDFLPTSAFGHWGATGTMMWIDRRSERWCVILTNQPYENSQTVIQRMSNLIATSM